MSLLGPSRPQTAVWAYNGRTPGPTLRVAQGQELFVRFKNSLAQPSTLHWHGIRIANAMDGVAHLTQHPVAPGRMFDYRFTCPDAGTFWYHPHMHEPEQLARGLCGLLIVEEPEPPRVDQDLALLINDWLLTDTGQIEQASFGSLRNQAQAGRIGNTITVNGQRTADFPVKAGERIRVRLANAANARVLQLLLEASAPKIIAIDGQPIPPREAYVGGLELPPGGRMDLILDMVGEPGQHVSLTETSRGRLEIARFLLHPVQRARPEPLVAAMSLTPNPLPEPDLAAPLTFDLVMSGGAQTTSDSTHDAAADVHIAPLAGQPGMVWAFNGVAGQMSTATTMKRAGAEAAVAMMGKPLFSVARGRTVVIRMVNGTQWPHAMHVHGHHFKVISRTINERDPYWWDTLLLAQSEAASIAFVADNPGNWMLHCHMLEHQASGMMGWFRVI